MIEKYKTRILLTITTLFIIIIIAWQAAIKPTIRLWEENNQIEEQLKSLNQAPLQISLLTKQIEIMDKMIGYNSGALAQEDIVNSISRYIKNNSSIELCSFPPSHMSENENYRIETFEIELQGTFNQLVRFINFFEANREIGKFSSLGFYKNKNRVTKKDELYLKIYLQSFQKKES